MQTTGKIGFHFGSQSTATGYGDYIRELDAAGIPATVMSVAGEGFGDIVGVWNNGSTVPHVAVIRCLSHNDVPRYDLPIDEAVENWLDRYVPKIGADVIKYHDRVITKHGNELDRNRIEWLANFYIALHPALLARMGWESHQICIFNFAGGNPDPDQWELILPQLKIFADNPDKFVIGCHEYSFDDTNIWNLDGGGNELIGRFQYLFDTCDRNNIKRPLYAIHEWGWRDKKIPDLAGQSMSDIDKVNELYCWYPEIIGAGIWTLQEWQDSGINLEVEKLIPHIKELTLNKRYEIKDEEPPMPEETLHEHLQRVAKEAQTVSYNRDAALQKAGNVDGFGITGSETRTTFDGVNYAVQPFGSLAEDAERYYYSVVGDWANVKSGDLREDAPPTEPSSPLVGLNLGYLFSYKYSDNYSPFNSPRDYDGDGIYDDKHEGLDADVIGGQPDNKVNVLCTYDGIVDRSLDSTGGYGKYVRVQHERNGSLFYTRYCHLDSRAAAVGDIVSIGTPIGEVGNTGNVTGEHVHFNLEVPGYGLSGYVVADVVDPYPLLPSDNMSLPPLSPTSPLIDTQKYFIPANQYGPKIVMKVGNGTQPMQLEKRISDVILRKGDGLTIDGKRYQDSEQVRVINGEVQKGVDTSDEANGGRDGYDLDWAEWIPRFVRKGETYHSTPTVRRFDRTTCQTTSTSQANDYLYIKDIVSSWVSPANSDIVLQDVMIVEWRSGTPDLNVPPTETYYLAPGVWYCGWGQHFIVEITQGQQNLTGELDCGM